MGVFRVLCGCLGSCQCFTIHSFTHFLSTQLTHNSFTHSHLKPQLTHSSKPQLTPRRIDYDDKWFDEVKAYSVYNADGSMQGLFFLDLYPRDGKYTHACVQDIQSSSIFDGEHNVLLSLAPHT